MIQGARWDITTGSIAESEMKELYPAMPVIYIKAVTQVGFMINLRASLNVWFC